MASELKVNTLTGVSTAGSIAVTAEGNSTTTNLQQGLAKAWGQYSGSGTTYADSFNLASATDNGTGDYTYAITNDMANANYTPQCTNVTTGNYILIAHAGAVGTIQVKSRSDSTSAHDDPNGIAIFGDLA